MELKTLRILYVFVSCPDDVKAERGIVEEICEKLNAGNGHVKGTHLVAQIGPTYVHIISRQPHG